jgi:hypothetical protein
MKSKKEKRTTRRRWTRAEKDGEAGKRKKEGPDRSGPLTDY